MTDTKVCRRCGEAQPPTAFEKRRTCNICRAKQSVVRSERNWRQCFELILRGARRRRGNLVTLTADDCVEMIVEQRGLCALSGVKLTRRQGDLAKVSIDRLDHGSEYVVGNVRLVTWAVNRMRNTMSDQEFLTWIKAIANTAAES